MENLKSYLDGELDLAQQAEVETHLRNDADLQKMVDEFRTISDTLKTADSGEPYGAETLEAKLQKAASTAKVDNQKIWRIAMTWSGSAACIALIAAVVFPVFAQSKSVAKNTARSLSIQGMEKAKSLSSEAQPREDFSSTADMAAKSAAPPQVLKGEHEVGGALQSQGGLRSQDGSSAFGRASTPLDSTADSSVSSPSSTSEGVVNGTVYGDQMQANKPIAGYQNFSPSAKAGVGKSGGGFNGGAEADKKTDSEFRKANGKSLPEPESKFKSDMRAIRDKADSSAPVLNDTPHGIYLERSGQVEVKVDDVKRAVNEASGMIMSLDGFVVTSEKQSQQDGGIATMIVRVPTKSFTTAIDKLESMGELISSNSNSQDLTTDMVENSTRMISWADEELRLTKELEKAKTENQKYYIRLQINNARVNLAAHKAQVKSLDERSKYSTINISFLSGDKAEKVAGNGGGGTNWSGNAFRDAKSGLGSIGQVLGVICIYGLVFSPIWLPFVIAGLIIRKKNQS